ncbi:unnamed protein product [Anisakis simplex]|uniref:RING-type domain-containing protein n=1 Tax=Anisakis simplex TaxID=6269 RepID=A0A158PNV3_ANISI|nr:unnamed protein product [Anisakis simplex]
MSEVMKAPCVQKDKSLKQRKLMRKVVIDDSDSDLLDEMLEEVSEGEYGEERRRCQRRETRCDETSPRKMTAISVHSVLDDGSHKNFHIMCLVCHSKTTCSDTNCSLPAYYICDKCMDCEKEHTREIDAKLLNSNVTQQFHSLSNDDLTASDHTCTACKCQICTRRREAIVERNHELSMLQVCWKDLRQNVRQMFREGLDATMTSLKGKKFNVERIKRNVSILAERDPHQLYKRLESIGHEYVMNLKSDDLWQILVAPQIVPALIKLFESGASKEKMELERVKLFIRTLLDRFSCQQETVRNMSPLLSPLDEEYLSQFGISWKILNHHIFDCVIYQDDLLINFIPSMEKMLKCPLILSDESDEQRKERERRETSSTDIPLGALELAQSFRVFHKLMITSREIFKKANAQITLISQQQTIINYVNFFIHFIANKAKGELLEEDLEFFKSQRRMIRNCTSKRHFRRLGDLLTKGDDTDQCSMGNDNDDGTDSEADAAEFTKRLHEIVDEGRTASICIDENGKVAPSMECKDCSMRHCSCDECRISHIIICGLLSQDDDLTTTLIWSQSSTDISENEEDNNAQQESAEKNQPNSSTSSSDQVAAAEHKPINRSLRFQVAKALFALHDPNNRKEIAWGDWEIPYDLSHDVEYDEHCLNDKKDVDDSKDANQTGSFFDSLLDENSKLCENDGFVEESEAIVAAIKDVAKQIGYDIQETVIGQARTRRFLFFFWDFYDLTKFGFDLNRELKAQIKTHLSTLFKSKTSNANENNNKEAEKNLTGGETKPVEKCKTVEKISEPPQTSSSSAKADQSSKTTISNGNNSHKVASNRCKAKKLAKTSTDVCSTEEEETESDSECSSPSLAGTADWSQIKLVNDAVLDSKTLEQYCTKSPLSEADRRMLKEALSKKQTIGGLALDLFGKKALERPQSTTKTQSIPSVTKIIRKLKATADKCDGIASNVIAITPKPLAASAKERLLLQMKEAEKRAKEQLIKNPSKTYDGEQWTTNDGFKVPSVGKVKKCAAKEWSKLEDVYNNKADVKANAHDYTRNCKRIDNKAGEQSLKSVTNKKMSTGNKCAKESTLQTNCVSGAQKEARTATRADKEKTDKMRVKQNTLKQCNSSKAVIDSCKMQQSATDKKDFETSPQKTIDPSSLSKTLDFNVDLNEFGLHSLSTEMAKKLGEGGKWNKLIAQAVGVGVNKMALSGKLEYKCENMKVPSNCESKEEVIGCHSDNDIDGFIDDDEDGDDEDEEKPTERTASGSRRDTRGHCDCCYCEMFGHTATESAKAGRVPQIRERLRLKLKRRNGQEAKSESQSKNRSSCADKQNSFKSDDKTETKSEETRTNVDLKPVTVADAPIDEILDYINEKDNALAQAAATKAAKRARQKQRKQEEKERLELERKKQEESRKAQEAEALRMKKEKQAAQQAARREKALKAEERRRKAAEDRARAQKRQKELLRQQQLAKEQKRAHKLQAEREAIVKKEVTDKTTPVDGEWQEQSVSERHHEQRQLETMSQRTCLQKQPNDQLSKKSHSISSSPLPNTHDNRPPSAPSAVTLPQTPLQRPLTSFSEFKQKTASSFASSSHQPSRSPLQNASSLSSKANVVTPTTTVSYMKQLKTHSTPLKSSTLPLSADNAQFDLPPSVSVDGHNRYSPSTIQYHRNQQSHLNHFHNQPLKNSLNMQFNSDINSSQQLSADFDCSLFNPTAVLRSCGPISSAPSQCTSKIYEGSFAATTLLNQMQSDAFDARSTNNTTSLLQTNNVIATPQLSPMHYYNDDNINSFNNTIPCFATTSSQSTIQPSLNQTALFVNNTAADMHTNVAGQRHQYQPSYSNNFSSDGFFSILNNNNKCMETPCSSSSSPSPSSSSICSISAQSFDRLPPYNGAPIGAKTFGCTTTTANTISQGGIRNCSERNVLRLGADCSSGECSSLAHNISNNASSRSKPSVNQDSYWSSTSSLFQNNHPFPIITQSLINPQSTATKNASHLTNDQKMNVGADPLGAAMKCCETLPNRTPFMTTSTTAVPAANPLATYESETKMLAAVVEQESAFIPVPQNPIIFEPSDPRLAAAVASMKFDPHETFKPRPETELQFLDPFEQEIEHFKRVMWVEKERSANRARAPLCELHKLEPENEENAVFHFDPLV